MKISLPKFARIRGRWLRRIGTPRLRPNRLPQYYLLHSLATLPPLAAGFCLYGWHALLVLTLVMLSTTLAMLLWQRIGARGASLHWSHTLWLALLLTMILPPHLTVTAPHDLPATTPLWPLAPAAGFLLVILLWATGGIGTARIHPLLITYLLLAAGFPNALSPRLILHPSRIFTGNLADVPPASATRQQSHEPWISLASVSEHDALSVTAPASQRLLEYTRGRPMHRAPVLMEAMLRDQMPPLENLVIGGHPGPIGASSAFAIIIGGLFLLYRGLIDYRIPLIIVLVSFTGFAFLPTLLLPGAQADWASALTFASYELMASPILLMAFFIATVPSICPAGGAARIVFALIVAILTIVCQFYLSVAYAPYLALALAQTLAPSLEQRFPRQNANTILPPKNRL